MSHKHFTESGYIRLAAIIGDPARGISPIIPVKKTTWWNGCRSGRFPKPVKISARCTAWKVSDIKALLESLGKEAE